MKMVFWAHENEKPAKRARGEGSWATLKHVSAIQKEKSMAVNDIDRLDRLWFCLDCQHLFVAEESNPQRCVCGSTRLRRLRREPAPPNEWRGRLREPRLRSEG